MVAIHGLNVCVLLVFNLFYLSLIFGKKTADENICKSEKYQDQTLKLLEEVTIADAFNDKFAFKGISQVPSAFEASDVILRPDDQVMYVVFDNSFHIGAFCVHSNIPMKNCANQLLHWPDKSVEDLESQFEGIAYNSLQDTYYVAQEAIPILNNNKKYQPNIFEIRIGKNVSNQNIQIIESCRVEIEFESDSKGFEGLEFVLSQKRGETYLLGLCEANGCASSKSESGADLGNGRVVILEKSEATQKNPCSWVPVDMINLPSSIQFTDYSAISIYREGSLTFPTHVAITSQENSQVWIGLIEEINEFPYFQISSLKKDVSYNAPRATETSDQCAIQYCNIEGVAWQGENQLILVSDKSKKDQDKICKEKGQSIHYTKLTKQLGS